MARKYDVHKRPEFVYIGRLPCGCCMALTSDYGDKGTGRSVAEFITEGLGVNRVSWDTYRNEVSQEPTFMACPHFEAETESVPLQAALPAPATSDGEQS